MLLPFKDSTVIQTCIKTALEVCGRVIAVTGHRSRELTELLSGIKNVVIVKNPYHIEGLFTSIQTGVKEVKTEAFFITPGDMPLIGTSIYRMLLEYPDVDSVRPVYHKIPGHPVLLSKSIIKFILDAPPRSVMKDILNGFNTVSIKVEDKNTITDLDTQEDYSMIVNNG